MNNELTAALAPSTLSTDDPAVLEQIRRAPQQVFVLAMLKALDKQHTPRPEPGAAALAHVDGLRRDIRVWRSRSGKFGADKPACFVSKSDLTELLAEATEELATAQTETAEAAV